MINQNDVSYLFFNIWAKHNIKIITPQGVVPYKAYPYQERLADKLNENKFTIIKEFRQSGTTTMLSAYALWEALWQPNRHISFFAEYDRYVIYINYLTKRMLLNLPEQPIIGHITPRKINDHLIEFDNGSSITFIKMEARIGKMIDHIIIDGASYISNIEDHWESLYPCIKDKVTITSTPRTKENWFYKIFTMAENKENSFVPVSLDVNDHPEFCKEEFQQDLVNKIGKKYFLIEYAGKFIPTNPDEQLIEMMYNDFIETKTQRNN